MKFSCVLVLIALPGIFGAHHHFHHVTIADCFGHACGDLESNCLIKEERGHLRPHCAEPHTCKHRCTNTTILGHDGCCCNNQACVDDFRSAQKVLASTVRCKECNDIRAGDCTHTTICHGDESCLLHFTAHRVESFCAPKHECDKHPGHHGHATDVTICCHDDACVAAATNRTALMGHSTTQPNSAETSSAVVHTCEDIDTTDYCKAYANQICTSFDYITHQHAVNYCAHTCNFCVEYLALKGHTTAMETQSSPTTTTTQPLPTTEKTTQVPTTTHLCRDQDTTGYCGDFKDTICTSVDFNVHREAVMKCADTCNFCFEYLAYMSHTTEPTTQKITTTAAPLPTTQSTTAKPLPTTQPTKSPSTPEPTAKFVPSTKATASCVDSDTSGYCQTNAMRICTSFDFAEHEEAVRKCAATCNFCAEYIALFMQTASTVNLVPVSASASMAPDNNPSFAASMSQPTTTHLCKDQDTTGFCATNGSHLCGSFDLNEHQEAVLKCADTCNFCVEYLVLYHPTTTAEPVTSTKYIPTVATTTVSPSTSVSTTTKLCTDKESSDYCSANAARLCTSFNFNVHQEAVMKCPDTCNFCVESLILNNKSP